MSDGPRPRIVQMRRSTLKAAARIEGLPEPSDAQCDRADWESGLNSALESARKMPRANLAPQAAAPTRNRVWIPLVFLGVLSATVALGQALIAVIALPVVAIVAAVMRRGDR